MKIVYYVHGTTSDNALKLCSGWKQAELNDLGREQASNLGKNTPYKFDVLFTSDLKRAIDSASLAFPDYISIQDDRLRECNYGDYDGKDKSLVLYDEHIDIPFPNGESLIDVEDRVRDFLRFVNEKYRDRTVAIIAHRAPQLALEVITKHITWDEAIENDWRKNGNWQPGWIYIFDDGDL